MTLLERYLKSQGLLVEQALKRYTAGRLGPKALSDAIRYSLFPGGKRFRPVLLLAAAETCGGRPQKALKAACAVEMIHTYSLIHDDLPCMDDGRLRRGRPTNHRVFGEALATLAGDALLTRAFGLLAEIRDGSRLDAARTLETIRVVAEAAGAGGMVGGQTMDLLASAPEGRKGPGRPAGLSRSGSPVFIDVMHRKKTAAMIAASAEAGAIVAGAPSLKRRALKTYGQAVGLAFQIVDDILDAAEERKKAAYPAVVGLPASRAKVRRLVLQAHRALRPFGSKAARLHHLADFIAERDH